MNLTMKDVRLRGCGFTLFPAAKEEGVDGDLMRYLLSSIYTKIEEEPNSKIPEIFSEEDFPESPDYTLKMLLDKNLVTKNGTILTLTPKSIKILERAAELQNKLGDENFYFCPCHYPY